MTLYAIIDKLKMLALKHPNVNSAYEGNIYELMNANPSLKYACFVITQQSHNQDDTYDHYGFNLFYVDRLVDDMEDNRVQIQSTGKSMLSNIIKAFCEEFDAECDTINYQTFTERFADECAGVYCTITIDMVKDIYCTEKYWDETWVAPMVSIRNQNKTVQFTENGTYIVEYDAENYTGLGKVSVEVNVPDLNGSYDEGYSEGKTDGIQEGYADGKADGIEEGYSQGKTEGYNEGKTDGVVEGKELGINEQKAKLESISISENGTYTREDGYNNIIVKIEDTNGSYDDGFSDGYNEGIEEGTSNAGAIIAETAQVLNITENGVYATKYSKDEDFGREVTGYFDDGTPFYNYAYLNHKAFKTDALVTKDSKMEVWWKPSNEWDNIYYGDGIVGTIVDSYGFSLRIKNGISFAANVFSSSIYDAIKEVNLENKWYHLSYSYDEGLFIDGEFCGKQTSNPPSNTPAEYGYINLTRMLSSYTQANGYFGMVKIDDNIYIPTEDGFINYYTKEPLEVYQNGTYVCSELPKFEGNLVKTVNVNVVPKIKVSDYNFCLAYSQFTEVPEWIDFDGITNMRYFFGNCEKLTTIPFIDTSNVTNMYGTFTNCSSLISVPILNTSNVTTIESIFANCKNLTTFPEIDTSNVTSIGYFIQNCTSLTSVPALNAGNVNNVGLLFGSTELPNLTDFGGFIGLKVSISNDYGFKKTPNLTYESCINILNGLYDFVGNGETPSSIQGKLKVHANFLTTVGDELSIGTNKGWTITA